MIFWTALALMILFEGALYAMFPKTMQRMMREIVNYPPETLRRFGLFTALIGFITIYLIYRG